MDRMEIIRIAGYTEDEKVEIAKRHLLPKAIRDHALQPKEFSVERRRDPCDHPDLHARSRRPQPRARADEARPQGGHRDPQAKTRRSR